MSPLEWILWTEGVTRALLFLAATWATIWIALGLRLYLIAGAWDRRDRPAARAAETRRRRDQRFQELQPGATAPAGSEIEWASGTRVGRDVVHVPPEPIDYSSPSYATAWLRCPGSTGLSTDPVWRPSVPDPGPESICAICSRPWLEHRRRDPNPTEPVSDPR